MLFRSAYAAIGLEIFETKDAQSHNTSMTWTRLGGPIGLAIVGSRQSCNSKIWQRYEPNYSGGSTDPARVNQWSSLTVHEWGHNVGMGHTPNSIMNPSIINGLPVGEIAWDRDPARPQLVRLYGGERIPTSIPPDVPGPPTGTGNIPRVSLSVTVPEGFKPGTYQLVAVPRPEV